MNNHYLCPDCGARWTDHWDCACDDDCPECGARHIAPVASETGDENTLWCDARPCHTCGELTPMHLLDGKDDGSGTFNIIECQRCYGPGWSRA